MQKYDDTQLYKLLTENNLKEIELFLNKYGINSVDRDGRTFIMNASVEGNLDIVKFLINNHVDINIKDKSGFSALHLAVINNKLDIVKYLVESGAIIDSEDNEGNTPLWRAMMHLESPSEISRYLISRKADINKKNKHGISPADLI